MADIVTVEAKALEGLLKGLEVLHKGMSAVGAQLRKEDFRPATFYSRSNPVEAVASALEACVLTANELGKAVKCSADAHAKEVSDLKSKVEAVEKSKGEVEKERDGYAEMAETATKAAERLAAGDEPCACSKSEKPEDCKDCSNERWLTAEKARALRAGGAFRSGKQPGRGSAIRTAV